MVKVISSVIRSIKQDKEDGGAISARPVKRLSVQQREHHTIDYTNLAQSSGNLNGIGNSFLVVFRVYENSEPSREVYVVFGSVITVA